MAIFIKIIQMTSFWLLAKRRLANYLVNDRSILCPQVGLASGQ